MAKSESQHNVRLSKSLSSLLRHNMLAEGLKPSDSGYVDVAAVLALPRFSMYSVEQVGTVNTFKTDEIPPKSSVN
jgi:RNA:NAD 2'-phosphotransferase (TPT1/KptA family)